MLFILLIGFYEVEKFKKYYFFIINLLFLLYFVYMSDIKFICDFCGKKFVTKQSRDLHKENTCKLNYIKTVEKNLLKK
jgi:hypothetical protein